MATNPRLPEPGWYNVLTFLCVLVLILAAFAYHGSDIALSGTVYVCIAAALFVARDFKG
jgi:hypothetical protein